MGQPKAPTTHHPSSFELNPTYAQTCARFRCRRLQKFKVSPVDDQSPDHRCFGCASPLHYSLHILVMTSRQSSSRQSSNLGSNLGHASDSSHLVYSRHQFISSARRLRLQQSQPCLRIKNYLGLTIDADRANRYYRNSHSSTRRFGLELSSKPTQGGTDDCLATEKQDRRIKRGHSGLNDHGRAKKLTIRIPSGRLFFKLVQLRRSSAVPAVIHQYRGRWILAKARSQQRSIHGLYDCRYKAPPRELVTIRIPTLSILTLDTSSSRYRRRRSS